MWVQIAIGVSIICPAEEKTAMNLQVVVGIIQLCSTQDQFIFLRFQIPIIFSNLNSNCSNLVDLRNLQEKVKKEHSVTKNCSDLSLFEYIVLVIAKFLQILGLQP